jgi:hypothetical protein
VQRQAVLSVFTVLLLAIGAHTQISQRWSADVPFAFIVKDKPFVAGQCSVNTGRLEGTLLVRGAQSRAVSVQATDSHSGEAAGQSLLIFNKYGPQFFLSRIVTKGDDWTRELPVSRREADVAKTGAVREEVRVLAVKD